ncbi:hypothetical protein AV274_4397 [Blastocystis sp. ATCC 50177/Nand II]|uniref:Uncharacterized protein n=2 Tax=Blastocystis sp. subtype 1 (strain ATCC 50177 / NandII) TaxID=478820 RepID=A0A196SA52_BLAHN|nr:hypothetical protein AV274_4397 [Blastocystis sp. ATCC 50177/Nand II]
MTWSAIAAVFLLFAIGSSKCVRCGSTCIPTGTSSSRTFMQVNNATGLYPFYVDSMTATYSDKGCSGARYEVIKHLTYDSTLCMGTIDSIYYRVVDKSDSSMNKILSSCGSKLTKFTDISKVDCKVDGVDPFTIYRVMIGSQQYNCIRFDDGGKPTILGSTCDASCKSEYNMGKSWMSTVFVVAIIVVVVLVITVLCVIFFVFKSVSKPSKAMTKKYLCLFLLTLFPLQFF